MSKKVKMIMAGLSGLTTVALGAFGAHGLKNIISENYLEVYKTGIFYHLIHSVVLLALAFADKTQLNKSFIFILSGIVLFSFSLYIYSITGIIAFAVITPFGGVSFLIGWLFIIYYGIKEL